jgi:hypothetical protein
MPIAFASWIHGHAGRIEHPDRLERTHRIGPYLEVTGRAGQDTWIHYAIPAPVLIDERRLRADAVLIRWQVLAPNAEIRHVHVYDGEARILTADTSGPSVGAWQLARFDIAANPAVQWGIGVSIGVRFAAHAGAAERDGGPHIVASAIRREDSNKVRIASVGCDFAPPAAR